MTGRPLGRLVPIAEVVASLGITQDQGRLRLTRLRNRYGVPQAARMADDHLRLVHPSEVELLRVPVHSALPKVPPPSLWHLTDAPAPPSTQAPRTRVTWSPRPRISDSGPRRMCIFCNKTKAGADFPQRGYDVCSKCVPASKAGIDLMQRAVRGGAPGLGKR